MLIVIPYLMLGKKRGEHFCLVYIGYILPKVGICVILSDGGECLKVSADIV